LCENIECYGEELIEYTGQSEEAPPAEAVFPSEQTVGFIEGLCLLGCDASFSMDKPAFPNKEAGVELIPGIKADEELTKLRMVAHAVHLAVSELYRISRPDEAFIGIIAFGARAKLIPDRQGRPFVISVREIKTQFGDGLGEYLYECFRTDKAGIDRQRTDIGAALQLARDIYDAALAGDLSRFGMDKKARILNQSGVDTPEGSINVHNVRILLYSDGEHNPDPPGPLTNPFARVDPSPLMTAFIGDEKASEGSLRGANQLKELATVCPTHRKKGYFLINTPWRYAILRNLFDMATKASGFCPECLKGVIRAGEEHQRHE
jgi:hypothetical protein